MYHASHNFLAPVNTSYCYNFKQKKNIPTVSKNSKQVLISQ